MPRPKGGGGGGAAAAAEEEDAPSTQQVRASVARTEALAERLDELRGRIAGEAESDLSLDESCELVFRRLAYSLVMFFTPPRLRPMSGMLWMTGRVREAQAPGTLYSVLAPGFAFVYEGCCVCLQQAGKRVKIGA